MSEILRTIFFDSTNYTPTDNTAVLIFVIGIFPRFDSIDPKYLYVKSLVPVPVPYRNEKKSNVAYDH